MIRSPAAADARTLVETSALVAIALEEPDWRSLTSRILREPCVTTAVNVFESALALAKQSAVSPSQAHADIGEILEKLSISVLAFTPEMIPHAVAARERYGRGRKGLNMGDCMSYAAARQLGLKLLYKGDDFSGTDVNG